MTAATPAEVIAAARALIGTPFRHRGRCDRGVDCAGLLLAVAERLGLPRPGPLHYGPMPPVAMITVLLAQYARPVPAPERGAVLQLLYGGRAQHLGIVADHPDGDASLIHAAGNLGCVVEHRLDARWRRRVVSCWRLAGVAAG